MVKEEDRSVHLYLLLSQRASLEHARHIVIWRMASYRRARLQRPQKNCSIKTSQLVRLSVYPPRREAVRRILYSLLVIFSSLTVIAQGEVADDVGAGDPFLNDGTSR